MCGFGGIIRRVSLTSANFVKEVKRKNLKNFCIENIKIMHNFKNYFFMDLRKYFNIDFLTYVFVTSQLK
jgi:hypothetical protein